MKKIMKIAFVAAFAAVAGYGVYANQQSETMSDLMLANVEALASGSEGGGLPWKGYYSNWDKGCCSPGKWNDECSGSFSPC